MNKLSVARTLRIIDNELSKRLPIVRIDKPDRTKAQFFEIKPSGRQFAVVVGDSDKITGVFVAAQTRILLDEFPPEIDGIQPVPIEDYYRGGSAKRHFSRLAPPNQCSVLVTTEGALPRLLEWYSGITVEAVHKSIRNAESNPNTLPSGSGSAGLSDNQTEEKPRRLSSNGLREADSSGGNDKKNEIANCQSELESVANQLNHEYVSSPGADVDVIAKRRVGQGPFRNLLEAVYGSACWVSGLRIERLLIASHIVPWSKSSPIEKTDRDNGLLLSVSWDAVFDKGFVSFDDNGMLMCSEMLDVESAGHLGISTEAKLPPEMLTGGRKKYLSWHREHVFENWKKSPGL